MSYDQSRVSNVSGSQTPPFAPMRFAGQQLASSTVLQKSCTVKEIFVTPTNSFVQYRTFFLPQHKV